MLKALLLGALTAASPAGTDAPGRLDPELSPPVRIEAAGKPIESGSVGHAAPFVGSGDGSVWLYPNGTETKAMELAEGRPLVPPVGDLYQNTPAEPTRGMRFKVCAADWNGDGRLDLLVGDFAYQKPKPVELTAEQKADQDQARAGRGAQQGATPAKLGRRGRV